MMKRSARAEIQSNLILFVRGNDEKVSCVSSEEHQSEQLNQEVALYALTDYVVQTILIQMSTLGRKRWQNIWTPSTFDVTRNRFINFGAKISVIVKIYCNFSLQKHFLDDKVIYD